MAGRRQHSNSPLSASTKSLELSDRMKLRKLVTTGFPAKRPGAPSGRTEARYRGYAAEGALLVALGGLPLAASAETVDGTTVNATVELSPAESLTVTGTGAIEPLVDGDPGVVNSTTGITVGAISNAGTIDTVTSNATGIVIATFATAEGGITNSGTINAGEDGDGILIFGASRVEPDAGATNPGDIRNSGSISAGFDGIAVSSSSSVAGSIINSGSITTDAFDGIFVDGGSTVGGDIRNTNQIQAGSDGIAVESSSSVNGDIANSGSITAGFDGIFLFGGTNVDGTIDNSGSITAGDNGIFLQSSASVQTGIVNSGSIVTGDGVGPGTSGDDGIDIESSSVVGGITNAPGGSIQADEDGIDIDFGSTVVGDVTNAAGASIQADDDGIDIDHFAGIVGAIVNDGSITAKDAAITITSSSGVTGGIMNDGSLTGALRVLGGDGFGGGIDLLNTGLVDLGVSESFISGDFTQDAGGTLAVTLRNFGDYGFPILDVDNAFLDGMLDLSFVPDFAPRSHAEVALVSVFGARTGTFTSFANKELIGTFDGVNLFIEYTGEGDVLLYAPTPGPLALIAFALPALFARRRRARD